MPAPAIPPSPSYRSTIFRNRIVNSLGFMGDSLTYEHGSANGNSYAGKLQRSGKRRIILNAAVGGVTMDHVLGTQLPQIIASGVSHCGTMCGVNDLAYDIGLGTPRATAQANLRAKCILMWNGLRAAGIEPLDVSLIPNNDATLRSWIVEHNVWRRLYCLRNGIKHLDAWHLLANSDGTGAFATGMYVDATHYSVAAAMLVADRFEAMLDNQNWRCDPLRAYTDDPFTDLGTYVGYGRNCVSLTDDDANGMPNLMSAELGSGVAPTYSVQPKDAGGFGKWARMTMNGAVNSGYYVDFVGPLATLGWNTGDTLAVGLDIRWVDVSGAATALVQFIGPTMADAVLYQEKGGATGDAFHMYKEIQISSADPAGYSMMFIGGSGVGYIEWNSFIVVNLNKANVI